MNFSAKIFNNDGFPLIILKDELHKTQAEIYSFGALLNSFIIDDKQNIIDSFTSCEDARENITNGFKSAKLSPFVCRLKNGEYNFQQKQHKTGKFYLKEEAIHGLLYDAPFIIKDFGADNEAAFVTLEYMYSNKNEGFPFEYLCTVTYKLEKENKLTIATTTVNQSKKEMPLCDGWHPYFKFDKPVNDVYFKINADKIFEFDDRLLPTKKILAFNNFQTLQKLNETFYDNCFVLNNSHDAACIIEDRQNNLRLSVFPDETYPYLQVYTPPHRNSIAIENLSAAPDAFNNELGLIILQPGDVKTFTTVFRAENF